LGDDLDDGPWSVRRREEEIVNVREAMAKTISTATPEDTVGRVASMMREEDCGFIPVVREDEVVGVVTDRDLVLRVMADGPAGIPAVPVSDVMTRSVWSVGADEPIEAAAHQMAEHGVRRLPVVDGGRLVGILSSGNLEQALHAEGPSAAEATLGVTKGA
jgi:CBS domain-containing protein